MRRVSYECFALISQAKAHRIRNFSTPESRYRDRPLSQSMLENLHTFKWQSDNLYGIALARYSEVMRGVEDSPRLAKA